MPSEDRKKMTALVLVGPGRRIAAVDSRSRRKVRFVQAHEIRHKLDPSTLVLVAGGEACPEFRARIDGLRRRYRERSWIALGRPDTLAATRRAYGGIVDAVMEAPLSEATLLRLARTQEEMISARRSAARSQARVETLESRLVLLSDTIQAAGSLLDPGMVSHFIMERASRLVGSDRWRLYRVDEGAGVLRLDVWEDSTNASPPTAELTLDQGIAGWTARFRRIGRFDLADGLDEIAWQLEWPGRPPNSS